MKSSYHFISFNFEIDIILKKQLFELVNREFIKSEHYAFNITRSRFEGKKSYEATWKFYKNAFLINNIDKIIEICKQIVHIDKVMFLMSRFYFDDILSKNRTHYYMVYSKGKNEAQINDAKLSYPDINIHFKELINQYPFLIIKQEERLFNIPKSTLKSNLNFNLRLNCKTRTFDVGAGVITYINNNRVISIINVDGGSINLYGLLFVVDIDDIKAIKQLIITKLRDRGYEVISMEHT